VTFILILAYNTKKHEEAMKHTTVLKPKLTTRTGTPRIAKDKNGNALLLCPFCVPPHPLQPNVPAACGTSLVLTAEQVIVRAKYDKNFICVKCGKGGGEMVKYQNGFIHVTDCDPNKITMLEPPVYSKFAALVYGMKNKRIKKFIEDRKGQAVPVEEIDQKGIKTGTVLGYFFFKDVKNGEQIPATTG
jgi:hypothetical protein